MKKVANAVAYDTPGRKQAATGRVRSLWARQDLNLRPLACEASLAARRRNTTSACGNTDSPGQGVSAVSRSVTPGAYGGSVMCAICARFQVDLQP